MLKSLIQINFLLITLINCNEDIWEFLDPDKPNTNEPNDEDILREEKSPYPMPSFILPSKQFIDVTVEGHYTITPDENMYGEIGTIKFYTPDPTKIIAFYIQPINLNCPSSSFIRWFDGWNVGEIIPYKSDHPLSYEDRFSDNICKTDLELKFQSYHSAQNFAQIDYRFYSQKTHSFSFFLLFKQNEQPCHALLLDSINDNQKCPYFYSYTLQNYELNRARTCSLFLIKQQKQKFTASFRIHYLQVGKPDPIFQAPDDDSVRPNCGNDHLYIQGNSRSDHKKTKYLDFCNNFKPDLERGGFPLSCRNITIRLKSSGLYLNKVIISYLPSTPDEICRWNDELREGKAKLYHTIRCTEDFE